MPAVSSRGHSDPGSRRLILDLLKRAGPQEAAQLALSLGVTAMAARQHLSALEAEGMVTHALAPRAAAGRPAKLWRLTGAAETLFPDGHAALALDLVGAMRTAFGPEGMDRLLAVRSQAQVDGYRQAMASARSLRGRVEALAKARSAEGYMAEVARQPGGAYLLIENHCPVCAVARACSGLCASELAVFRAALGPGVEVERTDHILAGARRCAYRIKSPTGL